ncbi:transposase [Nocardia brasiliensis]|uniref:transposase n=1 Tax=Nocardia brasiliensis TaxID=37326 RepID=UPI00245747F9|nr:transposase [Nocardia brasiliensis]
MDTDTVDLLRQTFPRRFDIEHTFRMLKQTLGWTAPKTRDPAGADRWTWMLLAAYTQLRLARGLARDQRRPWEKPVAAQQLTPARVRRVFRHLRPNIACPASAPKPSRPGPGRPAGRRNQRPAPRHDGPHQDRQQHSRTNTGSATTTSAGLKLKLGHVS